MRKIIILLGIALLVPPAYAQTGQALFLLEEVTTGVREVVQPGSLGPLVGDAVRQAAPRIVELSLNLPEAEVVQFRFPATLAPDISPTARLVPREKVSDFLFSVGDMQQFGTEQYFAPRDLVGPEKALFRGMRMRNIADLQNLFINGLQTDRVILYSRKIFTSPDPLTALVYAVPNVGVDADLPVLVKIPLTPEVQSQILWEDYNRAFFGQDIPAAYISDIWVLLDVNGKPDWCKAVLRDGKPVLIPGYGQLYDFSKEFPDAK